jgi:hypothetical protein
VYLVIWWNFEWTVAVEKEKKNFKLQWRLKNVNPQGHGQTTIQSFLMHFSFFQMRHVLRKRLGETQRSGVSGLIRQSSEKSPVSSLIKSLSSSALPTASQSFQHGRRSLLNFLFFLAVL